MIAIGENKATIYKGNFHPAQLYKGDKKIAGYTVEEFEGTGSVTLEDCYNDKLHNAVIHGNSVQDGEPTPDNPIEVQSVGELVTEGEYAGKYKIPVRARGKNLFGYISSYVANGQTIEQLPNGAIVQGNLSSSSLDNAHSAGWFAPGIISATGICPVLHTGDIITISADVTLLELIRGDTYTAAIYLCSREGSLKSHSGYKIDVGETKRITSKFTVTNGNETYYPIITLNSNVVKIENIQIEYGDTATPYEPYIEPQTVNIYLDEPLRKVGDYADYIDSDKDVVVRLNTEAEILKVGNDYNGRLSLCGYGYYNGEYQLLRKGKDRWAPIFCSYTDTLNWSNDVRQNISVEYSVFGVTNATELQAKFDEIAESGTPLKVVYTHETPIEEPIELPKLPTFKGTTIYEIGTQISAAISGKYKKVEV